MNTHDFSVRTADGTLHELAEYVGRPVLIVNVASKCGLTPQYEALETLHRETGLDILGFPCNQFGGQEPGSDDEIQDFCKTAYSVTFPIFAKVDVNGATADPLFRYLREQAPGNFGSEHGVLYEHVMKTRPESIGTDEIKWNFTKFLVAADGDVVRRYEPTVLPEAIRLDIETTRHG